MSKPVQRTRHLIKITAVLAAAACLVLLAAAWPSVSAHTDLGAGSDHSHGDVSWHWNYGARLVLTGDATGPDVAFAEDDDGKVVWQYVGPSTADDISNCNELGWIALAEKAKSIEAVVSADAPGLASVSLDVSSATDQSRYCFRPQVNIDGEPTYYYLLSQPLEASSAAGPAAGDAGLVVSAAAPPADSDVPTSVTVAPAAGTEISPGSWQYAEVADARDCNSSNDEIAFNEPAAGNNAKELDAGQAGKVFCFRALLADGEHVYEAYEVPGETGGETSEEDGGVSWVFIVSVAALIAAAAFIVAKSARSKN